MQNIRELIGEQILKVYGGFKNVDLSEITDGEILDAVYNILSWNCLDNDDQHFLISTMLEFVKNK